MFIANGPCTIILLNAEIDLMSFGGIAKLWPESPGQSINVVDPLQAAQHQADFEVVPAEDIPGADVSERRGLQFERRLPDMDARDRFRFMGLKEHVIGNFRPTGPRCLVG